MATVPRGLLKAGPPAPPAQGCVQESPGTALNAEDTLLFTCRETGPSLAGCCMSPVSGHAPTGVPGERHHPCFTQQSPEADTGRPRCSRSVGGRARTGTKAPGPAAPAAVPRHDAVPQKRAFPAQAALTGPCGRFPRWDLNIPIALGKQFVHLGWSTASEVRVTFLHCSYHATEVNSL